MTDDLSKSKRIITQDLGKLKTAYVLPSFLEWIPWERAGKLGVLEFSEIVDKEIDDWFRPAYNWMAGQLEERVKEYPCNKYPIWAWHHLKPDLRRSGHLPRDTVGVRVEVLVNSGRVLLSDFEAWHAVLNCWYLSLSEEESDS